MEFQAKVANPVNYKTDCAVVAVYENQVLSQAAEAINLQTGQLLERVLKQGDFNGESGQTLLLQEPKDCKCARLLLLGLGKKEPLSPESFNKAIGKAATALKATKSKNVTFYLDDIDVVERNNQWKATQITQLTLASFYKFDQLKSGKKTTPSFKKGVYAVAATTDLTAAEKGVAIGNALNKGIALTKDLGNLPGNICTPAYLASTARKLGDSESKLLSVKILSEKQMKDLGMGSLLSVSAGSDQPAQLIVMEYKGGKKSDKPVVLVGKGITFDTGGISLKPGANMDEMKYDMCGAASVFGAMQTLLELQPAINVVGIVAAAENMPSGRATKPGDIVTSMSGQTIEVLNTDAEGRLVLCDALTYAERYDPQAVVDIATLTGACVVALGKHATGLFSNNDDLADKLLAAGKQTGDKAWRMPLWDEYQEQLDSNFADMANIGGPQAGSVTAACFLSRFTKKYHWAHLDIAGTAWHSGAAKGASGRPVPLLVEFLLSHG